MRHAGCPHFAGQNDFRVLGLILSFIHLSSRRIQALTQGMTAAMMRALGTVFEAEGNIRRMHIPNMVFFVLALMAGTFAFGFLLAGLIAFQQHGAPGRSAPHPVRLVHLFSGGLISIFSGVASHWRSERELRRLFYIGIGALLVSIGCIMLCFRTLP